MIEIFDNQTFVSGKKVSKVYLLITTEHITHILLKCRVYISRFNPPKFPSLLFVFLLLLNLFINIYVHLSFKPIFVVAVAEFLISVNNLPEGVVAVACAGRADVVQALLLLLLFFKMSKFFEATGPLNKFTFCSKVQTIDILALGFSA